jgi:hypothetical protein
MMRFIKGILLITVVFHIVHTTYVINTQDAELKAIRSELAGIQAERIAERKAAQIAQAAAGMGREVKSALNTLDTVSELSPPPKWPTPGPKQ